MELILEGVVKEYAGGQRALDGVSLAIGPGVFGLLGPNGAGKTSLMEILAGQLDWEQGHVALSLPQRGRIDRARQPGAWRRSLGYMPQLFDFPARTTGREVLEEGALLLGLDPRRLRPRMEALLDRVNLTFAADRHAASYSRGMKQRLGFALAVLHDPPLLLLDEPTAGLDPVERVFFRELLAELAHDRIVLLSTHIVGDVERCCQQVAVVRKGRVLYHGALTDLVASARGSVWEHRVTASAVEALVQGRSVVSLEPDGDAVRARMVAPVAPSDGAVACAPRLEDAYVALLR